jgi:adenylosuccinate synthase
VGGFDVVASSYGIKLQGATEIAVTKLACWRGWTEYRFALRTRPMRASRKGSRWGCACYAQPVYEYLPDFPAIFPDAAF